MLDSACEIPSQVSVDTLTGAANIAWLKAEGHFVVCYVSGGTLEDFRSDYSEFPESLQGLTMDNWDEQYVYKPMTDANCDGVGLTSRLFIRMDFAPGLRSMGSD